MVRLYVLFPVSCKTFSDFSFSWFIELFFALFMHLPVHDLYWNQFFSTLELFSILYIYFPARFFYQNLSQSQ